MWTRWWFVSNLYFKICLLYPTNNVVDIYENDIVHKTMTTHIFEVTSPQYLLFWCTKVFWKKRKKKINYSRKYSFIYLSFSSTDYYVTIFDLTFNSQYGPDQDFIYFNYGEELKLENIVINASNGDGYSSNDLIYTYYTNNIIINNVKIYDINNGSGLLQLFDLSYSDSISIENVLISSLYTKWKWKW